MKKRFYFIAEVGGLREVEYSETLGKKELERYSQSYADFIVFGTLKASRMKRHQVDYAVMLKCQEKGLSVGRLYRVRK